MKRKMFSSFKAGLFFLFVTLLVITTMPLINAELGTFEQGKDVELIQTCNNCTYCNLTSVKYPNGTDILKNVDMHQNKTFYSYTLAGANTTYIIGVAKYCYECGNEVEIATGCINFEITPTGQEITDSQGFVSIGLMLAIVALAFLFMYFGFKFSESELFPIALLFMAISLLLAVYSLHLGYIFTESILYPLAVQGGQSAIFIGIMWGMVALILIGMLFFTMKVLKELKIRRNFKASGEEY